MVEASYVTYPTLGWQKGKQQTPESCCSSPKQLPLPYQFELCSSTRQMRENKVLDVNGALTFTVIDSRNTNVSCQEWESRERGSSPGESQIALGAWENTQKDQGGSNTKKQ